MKMTEKRLQKMFQMLNDRFFDGQLNCWTSFKKMATHDGRFNMRSKEITIDSNLKKSESLVQIVLLHEMAHAVVDSRGYRGYPEDGGHGGLYQVELDRLYKAGAYDGLL